MCPTISPWKGPSAEVPRAEATAAAAELAAPRSLRSGGSSAAEAIGVQRFRGNWLGGWSPSSRVREVHYLDPSVLPTPAAYSMFGWLRAGVYSADAPVCGCARRVSRLASTLASPRRIVHEAACGRDVRVGIHPSPRGAA